MSECVTGLGLHIIIKKSYCFSAVTAAQRMTQTHHHWLNFETTEVTLMTAVKHMRSTKSSWWWQQTPWADVVLKQKLNVITSSMSQSAYINNLTLYSLKLIRATQHSICTQHQVKCTGGWGTLQLRFCTI